MPRTIEIEEREIWRWTCPKCGGHWAECLDNGIDRCGSEKYQGSGCGAEFPASDYEANSVVTGTQDDLLGAVYRLLMEEAKRRGHECMVFGALPDGVMTFSSGTVDSMDGVPFYWVRTGNKSCTVCGAYGFTQRPDGCVACQGPV
jgi:hypothetical protein